MPRDETTSRFAAEIGNTIDYFRREYDMSLAAMVGTLQCAAFDLMIEQHEAEDDAGEEE